MRSGNLFSKRSGAVLDAPARDYASATGETPAAPRRAGSIDRSARNAPPGSFDDDPYPLDDDGGFRSRRGVRLSFNGRMIPRTLWGRIAAGAALVLLAGVGLGACVLVRNYLLKDEHFAVQSSSSIEIAGNTRMTRAQLLSVFGEDVERNIFRIPLDERRAELERLPWVGHATVMRLLPNRVRVAIVERTPVAFVRQGSRIGLVDANGVLLDMPTPDRDDSTGTIQPLPHYSFPVLTGISADDPISTRAARMKIYMGFVAELDAAGDKISQTLSEVDLSNPEDVKAIVPDRSGQGADILVHFGAEKFLERYTKYEQHLPEWRAQYPKLASVDMRYERQVVLEMKPGSGVPVGPDAAAASADGAPPVAAKPAKPAPKPVISAAPVKKAPAKAPVVAQAKAPVAQTKAPVASSAPHPASMHAVPPAAAPASAKPAPVAAKPAGKPAATATSQGVPR